MHEEPQSSFPRADVSMLRKTSASRIALLVFVSILIAMMFPVGTPIELEYKVGGVWAQKDLIASFSFPVYRDDHEYAGDVEEARKGVYPIFQRSQAVQENQLGRLGLLFDEIEAALLRNGENRSAKDSASGSKGDLEISFSEREWSILSDLGSRDRLASMEERLAWIGRKCWDVGILDRPHSLIPHSEIALRSGTEEVINRAAVFYEPDEVRNVIEVDLRETYKEENAVTQIAQRIGEAVIRPNVHFDSRATTEAVTYAVEAVPRTIGFVQENERIVSKHQKISDEVRLKLESFRRAKADRSGDENLVAQFGGVVLHVLIVLTLFAIYLSLFRGGIVASHRKLVLIGALIIFQGLIAYMSREMDVDLPVEYLIVVPVASMLLTILFDSRVAFYGTVVIAFLVAGIRGNDYSVALAALAAGALSVYTVRDIRNRTQIFRSMGFIFLGYSAAILALALERFTDPGLVLAQLSLAAVNSLISPVLTYGLLIFFEKVFRITTDLTLIELSRFNHPLLQRLAEKTPGTYHHSMTIASLAESAALAIGANDVLARAGAYFHDIGKINKPFYFVENQRTSRSRHDRLDPKMSAEIIKAHVRNGIELAEEYRLPQEIVDFIPMHHGTTRIEFFYDKAVRQANVEGGVGAGQVDESDFRYTGPKPQTKETGILMLADSIEARVRSLDDHAPHKLKETIEDVVRLRFEQGELDECPLTLKNLTNIKEAFYRVLQGVYHSRVKYPKAKDRKGGSRKSSRSKI